MSFFGYARLYFLLAGKYVQARMQYRVDFLVSTFGITMGNVAAIGALWIVFTAIPNLAGYSYAQMVFLYSFALLVQSPTQIIFDHLWMLRNHTNQGTFLKYYFKPLPMLFYYVSEMVDLKGFGTLVFGIAAFVWASMELGIDWTWMRILLFPGLLLGGAMIFVSLMILAASSAFWIKDSFSILAFVSGFRDHARYPLGIYNSFFQWLFTFVLPIGYIAYYPAQFYLTSTLPDPLAWASPVFAVVLFGLALAVWKRGTRRWASTGS